MQSSLLEIQFMPAVRLIVCEKAPRWAVALRRELRGLPPQIVETRSLTSSATALADAPASLVLVDIQERKLEPALEWLDQISRRFPLARVLGALPQHMAPAEALVREAGAIDVLFSTQQAASVARLAHRQFAIAPRERLELRQLLAERMPWPAYAVAPS